MGRLTLKEKAILHRNKRRGHGILGRPPISAYSDWELQNELRRRKELREYQYYMRQYKESLRDRPGRGTE